jgi:hypothetical protein
MQKLYAVKEDLNDDLGDHINEEDFEGERSYPPSVGPFEGRVAGEFITPGTLLL